MVLIFGLLVLGLGIWLIKKSWQNKREVDKYEFDNRTSGGVVQFTDFEAKKKFDWKRQRTFGLAVTAAVVLFLGLVFTLIGFAYLH